MWRLSDELLPHLGLTLDLTVKRNSTLLALLRQSLFVGDGVPVNLANILSGASRDHDEQIMVATSQVPSFDRDFQNPTYVYRSLGVLQRVRINFDPPPLRI